MTKFYIIDADNCLSASSDEKSAALEVQADGLNGATFASLEELTDQTEGWLTSRFVEIWNSFAGAPPFGDLKEVRRFTDRKSAVARIWQAAQRLGEEGEKEAAAEP